jgi:16S rRNA G966 N2-methylase RsmD
MTTKKQKLELTWIGKDKRPKLEPRILLEDPSKSYHAKQRVSDNDIFDNRLIFGDNLLALKSLEQKFMGKVKCVFIDPPYNKDIANKHYAIKQSVLAQSSFGLTQQLAVDNTEWTPNRIEQRQKQMAKMTLTVWRVSQLSF